MKPMRTMLVALLVAAVPQVTMAQANQGWAMSVTMTTDSANGGTPITMTIELEMLGAKQRTSISTSLMPAGAGKMYIVRDSAAGTITNVMTGQSVAMIMDDSLAAQTKPDFRVEMVGTPTITTEDLGAGEPIAGQATRHFRLTAAGETKIIFGDETCGKKSKTVSELWTTDDPDVPDVRAALKGMAGASLTSLPADATAGLDSLMRGKRMLRGLTTVSVPTAHGDSVVSHTRSEVSEMRKRAIDPADFEVPAGFQTMDMREMMKGMDASIMGAARANMTARMKKSMCG